MNHHCYAGNSTVSETVNKLEILTDSARKMAYGRDRLAQVLNLPLRVEGVGVEKDVCEDLKFACLLSTSCFASLVKSPV